MKEQLAKRYTGQQSPIRLYKPKFKREHLPALFHKFGFKRGAEIGVQEGVYSENICKDMPDVELLCIDPWWTKDTRAAKHGATKQEEFYETTKAKLAPYNVTIIRKPSMEALQDIPDGSLDFVYIDGCHEFDYVMTDIIWWSTKVRKDGIVAGHDYYHFKEAGVVRAVDFYTYMHGIHEWYVTANNTPSFFWAKP